MDDCQKFLRFVLRCSVVCEVGKNIAETSGYAVSFSLQIRSMVFTRPRNQLNFFKHGIMMLCCDRCVF